jgi:hypothetical protein
VGGGGGGGGGGASSPDSSSDSSAGSPQHSLYDGPNVETERCLPGVIMAAQVVITTFMCFFRLRFSLETSSALIFTHINFLLPATVHVCTYVNFFSCRPIICLFLLMNQRRRIAPLQNGGSVKFDSLAVR